VVGIVGGRDKCALLIERLGFDAAVDHRAGDWREQLVAATPEGIDVDFENVGGEIMDEVLARLNLRARVVLCGLISAYNDVELPPGPRNFRMLLTQRVRLQGFIVLDHLDRRGDAVAELSGWLVAGELEVLETVVEGFEQLPTAINMLFDGANVGKLVVHVADN
jgi:NADPH-dependent curcumin reductase CurA